MGGGTPPTNICILTLQNVQYIPPHILTLQNVQYIPQHYKMYNIFHRILQPTNQPISPPGRIYVF
jgi:hypothetical protein